MKRPNRVAQTSGSLLPMAEPALPTRSTRGATTASRWSGFACPEISRAADRIFLCYGDPDAARATGSAWDDDFVGVWHFSQDVFTDDVALIDSTEFAHDGLPNVTTTFQPLVDSRLGEGLALTDLNQFIVVEASPELHTVEALTLEVVIRPSDLAPLYQEVLRRDVAYSLRFRDSSAETASVQVGLSGGASITGRPVQTTTDDWLYLTGTYDMADGTLRVCLNGEACGEAVTDAGTLLGGTPQTPIEIGFADAIHDEVRISRVRRPSAWIEAMGRGIAGGLIIFGE